ncbi:MAG: hypothetical protein AB7Q23_02795 [Hyphomonadaceae bacterium]
MRRWISILAVAALALGACERAGQSEGGPAEQSQTASGEGDSASATASLQAQLDAAYLGKTTPPEPDGFTSQGGTLDGEEIGVGALWVVYGPWTHANTQQWVAYVQRTTGTAPANERGQLPAEIVSVLAIPAPQAGEIILSEYCAHPDYPEPSARIFAIAATRPNQETTAPPSAAWRLDRASARLLPIDDPARVTCSVEPS